jgi:hypothetical protein
LKVCGLSDHPPPHVHGFYAKTEVIIDLLADGKVRKSSRGDAVTPSGTKRSDVRRILDVAARHAAELYELWEKIHGTAS